VKKEEINSKNNILKNNNQDLQNFNYPDFPVMQTPVSIMEIDEINPKPIPKATPSEFSWMNNNGKDWTTSAKNQGNCGSCWAFAAIGVFESVIKIKEGSSYLSPDLSEQYILSCLRQAGSCNGGNAKRALELIMKTTPEGNGQNGVVPEDCFEYYASHQISCSEKCENWEENLVPLLNYGSWSPDGSASDRERIKTTIMDKGPVVAHIMATDTFKKWGANFHNPSGYFFSFGSISFVNHVVMIVGWKDNPLVPRGGYWICKNSWGPEWGYDGFFNIAYGCLNIDRYYIVWADYDPNSYDWVPYANTGGPYGGYPNQEVIFDAGESIGFEGNIIDYSWDFGDQNTGIGKTTSHTYQNLGKYTVTLTITDNEGNTATKTTNLWIQNTNNKPDKPTINGPSNGRFWRKHEYKFSSTDADGNDLLYYIDWGDGKKEEWIGPYESGEEISLEHIWTESTIGSIRVRVKDPYGELSEWETLNINIPRFRIPLRFLFLDFIKNLFYLFN
jgi:C1A family cysteine protease